MDFIKSVRDKLKDFPRSDADDILMHVLGLTFSELVINDFEISNKQITQVNELVARRIAGEPTAYLIGKKHFWEYDFKVTKDTLIPRPETEVLVDVVLRKFKQRSFDEEKIVRILDLGTGSGCILISILKDIQKLGYNVQGVGLDISQGAIDVARFNAESLGVDGIDFICCDWKNIKEKGFDIIVSNPPYIPTDDVAMLESCVKDFEPKTALDGFEDGLECYRQISVILPKIMKNNSIIALEHGVGQSTQIVEIMRGVFESEVVKDLTGKDRIIISK